jgi:tetratricopeptide (TPR) repeat protein
MKPTLIFTVVLAAATSSLAAPRPATAPADLLLERAKQAITSNEVSKLATEVEKPLREALADVEHLDLPQLTRLAALREFSRYFADAQPADDRQAKLLLWLLDQPQLLSTLMMAVSEQDAPERVLAVLAALRHDEDKRLEEFPDLTAALCTVWDTPARSSRDKDEIRPDTNKPVWLFKYLAGSASKLRFNPKELPWQLGVYVVDNPVSQAEIEWVVKRYQGRGAIGGVYFDVPYDRAAFYEGVEKRIDSRPYILPNLVQFGGICGDQAYYAVAAARSLGVPATYVSGRSAMAESHAWVGFLDLRGKQVYWNFKEGRYPEMQFMRGDVTDPQTRRRITESDVSLLAALAGSKPADRLASVALRKSRDLVAPEQQMALLTKAINLSPGNRGAWMVLADLGAASKLSEQQMTKVTEVVTQFAAKPYPDFAAEALMRMNSGRGTDQQIKALDAARNLFRDRPDLVAEIRLAQAKLLTAAKRTPEALNAYGQVLAGNRQFGPILLTALEQIEALLRQQNELPRLSAIYKQTWEGMPTPQITVGAAGTPYFIIGERYIAVLKQLGNEPEATRVQSRLDAVNRPATKKPGY